MARYKGLARGGILATLDLVAQIDPGSPDQTATGFSSASKSGDRLTLAFDREGTALGQFMGSVSTYWMIPLPPKWDLTKPWQETVIEITEVSPPNATFSTYDATVYAGFGRTDEGAGCGGALRWTGTSSRNAVAMYVGGAAPADAATNGRGVRVFMPHMFNGSVPRVDVAVAQLYNVSGSPLGASRAPTAVTMQASTEADGSDMRFVLGAGPANGGAATGGAVSLTIKAKAFLLNKRVDGM